MRSLTSVTATCEQQRGTNSNPDGQTLASTLLVSIQTVCNNGQPEFPPNSNTESDWNTGSMILTISRSDSSISLSDCSAGFDNIVTQCISSGTYWGGDWSLNGATFSISNSVSDGSNPLVGAPTPSLKDLVGAANDSATAFSLNPTDTGPAQAVQILLAAAIAGQSL